ncbi:MAG: hypothetical protein ABEK04_03140 [Candidatus Nanohalobium sp.]
MRPQTSFMELPQGWENLKEHDLFSEFYFISIALILAFGTLQTSGTVLNTDKPVVSVVSCSMYPGPGEEGLYKGDILVVKGSSWENINVGDTVVYNVPDRIEFSIAAQKYSLEKNKSSQRPSTVTPAEKVTLVQAQRDSDGDRLDEALIMVDGKKMLVEEENSYSINGYSLKVGKISAMPIPVVHRVVKKESSYLETKGINNPGQLEFEKNVRPDQIHGKVFFRIPRVGLIKILAMDFVGFNGDQPLVLDSYRSCSVQA